MSDYDVVTEDSDLDETEERRKDRRWSGLLAIIILLALLLCVTVTGIQEFTTGGSQQARFIARNAECLQCHTEKIADFSRMTVHSPFGHKECTTCHTPHGKKVTVTMTRNAIERWRRATSGVQWLPLRMWFDFAESATRKIAETGPSTEGGASTTRDVRTEKSELTMPESELCWMCHGNLGGKLEEEYQHQPFEASRCTNCHNPHAADEPVLLTQAPNTICLTCHPMGIELSRMQSHPPAKEGWCTNCHDPHASAYPGILVTSQRDLCFQCHPSVAQKDDMAVQHVPFLNDQCTGCHEPHGSDYMPLLLAEQPGLCYECHPAIENQFAAASHHPVGLDLTCVSCHDAHAAQYSGLLTALDNNFCYQCHGEFQPAFEPSAHNQSKCIGCHTPHGSDFAPILQNSNPDLCFGCHGRLGFDDRAHNNNHPVRPVFYDINARRQLNCTTSCHNPHGSQFGSALRYFDEDTDGTCLMCHAVTEGKRVGIEF